MSNRLFAIFATVLIYGEKFDLEKALLAILNLPLSAGIRQKILSILAAAHVPEINNEEMVNYFNEKGLSLHIGYVQSLDHCASRLSCLHELTEQQLSLLRASIVP